MPNFQLTCSKCGRRRPFQRLTVDIPDHSWTEEELQAYLNGRKVLICKDGCQLSGWELRREEKRERRQAVRAAAEAVRWLRELGRVDGESKSD